MAHLYNSTLVDTPMQLNVKYHQDERDLSYPTFYQELIANLVYLIIIRSDISHDVNIESQFLAKPHHLHLAIV